MANKLEKGTNVTLSNNQYNDFKKEEIRIMEANARFEAEVKDKMAHKGLLLQGFQLAVASGVCKTQEDVFDLAHKIEKELQVDKTKYVLESAKLSLV